MTNNKSKPTNTKVCELVDENHNWDWRKLNMLFNQDIFDAYSCKPNILNLIEVEINKVDNHHFIQIYIEENKCVDDLAKICVTQRL